MTTIYGMLLIGLALMFAIPWLLGRAAPDVAGEREARVLELARLPLADLLAHARRVAPTIASAAACAPLATVTTDAELLAVLRTLTDASDSGLDLVIEALERRVAAPV